MKPLLKALAIGIGLIASPAMANVDSAATNKDAVILQQCTNSIDDSIDEAADDAFKGMDAKYEIPVLQESEDVFIDMLNGSKVTNNSQLNAITSFSRKRIVESMLKPQEKAVALALLYHKLSKQLGMHYTWQGSYHNDDNYLLGFDCAGFMMAIFEDLGLLKTGERMVTTSFLSDELFDGNMLRLDKKTTRFDSYEKISNFIKPGDLIVWDSHIAMYAGNDYFIHCTRRHFDKNNKSKEYALNERIGVTNEGPQMLDRVTEQDGSFWVVRPDYSKVKTSGAMQATVFREESKTE